MTTAPENVAERYVESGRRRHRQGALAAALADLEQALAFGDRCPHRAEVLVDVAYVQMDLMEFDRAEETIGEATAVALAVDDRPAALSALGTLGQLRKRQGDYATALQVARDGFELAAGIGDRHRVMLFALDEAFALDMLGDLDGAITAARTARTLANESGDPHDRMTALGKLGALLRERGGPGDLDAADEIATAGLVLAVQEQDRVEETGFLVDLGMAHLRRGEPEAAIRAFGEALLGVFDTGKWHAGSGLVATLATRPTTRAEVGVLWFAARAAGVLPAYAPEALHGALAHFGTTAVVRAVRLDDREGAEAGLLDVWEAVREPGDETLPLFREAVRLVVRWYGGHPVDVDAEIVAALDDALQVEPPLARLLRGTP